MFVFLGIEERQETKFSLNVSKPIQITRSDSQAGLKLTADQAMSA